MSARNNESREQLSAYLDGELSEAAAAAVDRALRSDPDLARELDRLQAVRRLVASLPRESAPPGLASRVLAQVRPGGRTPWTARLARLAAAAVVLIAVGLGITMVCSISKAPRPDGDRVALTPWPERPGAAPAGVFAAADVEDMPIVQLNAGNRVVAEQELEEMFGRNDIRLVTKTRAKVVPAAGMELANFYDRTQTGLNQTRYTVVMDTKRLQQIISELNSLRASHDIAVIPMSRQLEPGPGSDLAMRGRDFKTKDKIAEERWHHAAAPAEAGKPAPATVPRARMTKMVAYRVGAKAMPGVAAASRPATESTTAPAAPAVEPLDYRQFLQDGKRRKGRLASAEFQELVIIVNGDAGPVSATAAEE